MSQFRKAVVAFLAGVVTTTTGWAATIQTDAPQATSTAVAILGAVSTLATAILVYLTPNGAPA